MLDVGGSEGAFDVSETDCETMTLTVLNTHVLFFLIDGMTVLKGF